MARPPQYERPDDLTRDVTAVKVAIKHLVAPERAQLLAWMLLYYADDGSLFARPPGRRRKRIALDDVEYWLVRLPNRGS